MGSPKIEIIVQREDFDIAALAAELTEHRFDIGAVVSFTGLCRDEAGTLAALELEHYPGMAEKQIEKIAIEACARWPVRHLVVIHRYGKIAPGGNIVGVIATSKHRAAAFSAAGYMMDFLKNRAPFWKKQHLKDGSEGEWVAASERDEAAMDRWAEE